MSHEGLQVYPSGANTLLPITERAGQGGLSADLARNRAKLPLWRRTGIAGVAAVAATLAPGGSDSAEANGTMLLTGGGINTNAECVEGENLLMVNPEYARQIANGEVIIAGKDAPVALSEGDRTAALTPITPEEALQKLIITIPACEPTPTPELKRHTAQELIKLHTKGVTPRMIEEAIEAAYANNTNQEVTDKILPKESEVEGRESAKRDLNLCTTENRRQEQTCEEFIFSALAVHMITKDPNFWNLTMSVKGYHDKKWPSNIKTLNQRLVQHFPEGLELTLEDF